jgi:predicted MPP superfamily phosphohydrolase
MSDEKIISTGAELRSRMRASGQTLEHSREKGYFLSHTHEPVSALAVAEYRISIDRMRNELKIDPPRLSRSL